MKALIITALSISLFMLDSLAQVISKEGFSGLPTALVGLQGSGSDATGWTSTGWQGGDDERYRIVTPIPAFNYQVAGGDLISGGDRSLFLTTAPEPVPNDLAAYRDFPTQNTTIYFSFLVRPKAIGTGSDSLGIRFGNESSNFIRLAFEPDQAQRWLNIEIRRDGGSGFSGGGSGRTLLLEQTYLVVGRITRPSSTSIKMEYWLDPKADFFEGPVYSGTVSGLNESSFNRLSIPIISTDTGGPATSVIIDEFRMGYTWQDVVAQRAHAEIVPDLSISTAVDLRWQTENGVSYQVQYSFDLDSWINLGSVISGNGQIRQVYDSTGGAVSKFYRVVIK